MSKRAEEIRHSGIVKEITPSTIVVEIEGKSACSQCHAKGACAASESKIKRIDVRRTPNVEVEVGERVEVVLKASLGLKAVFISYVLPLIILLILLLTLPNMGVSELLTGLISLLAVGGYFVVIYLLRKRLAAQFDFVIAKTNY
ncbi:MAG: SoxR reducing system RseC family protein [bacterium]|nr:SoxR reducing system RseC family protein [bacterium]MDY2650474.1 SoxR reducing system RseC family protein [Candidatus Egerieousia sp.]